MHRGGHASAAGDRDWTSEPDSAARWRRVAHVSSRRAAGAASLLVQERPRPALCRPRPEIRPTQLRHPPDFR